MFDLNDANFLLYAAKHYDSPHMLTSEFNDDLQRIKYIKRIFRKYRQTGDLKERLVLNHVTILFNVFGVEPTINMLYFKIDEEDYPLLKTILIYMNHNPPRLKATFNGLYLHQELIPLDGILVKRLRSL